MMSSALIIRHTPYEGIAGFRQPVEEAGFVIDRVDVTDPDFSSIDFLEPDLVVMMGGPMGVYERDAHPWIDCEIARLALRIAAGRPTLAVCLGAQIVAAAMGARVFQGPVKEVGFAPIALNQAGARSPLRHIADVSVLHWHGDTFDLPDGAELLATSESYPQAFRRGPNLLALQCHPEMGDDPRIDIWMEDAAYIEAAGLTVAELRAQHDALGPAAVVAGQKLIADWLDRIA